MKIVIISALFVICLSLNSSANIISSSAIMPEKIWASYKLEHNKNYDDVEDAERFELFKKTLKTIEEHNAKYEKGESTFKMGLNHMSDWRDSERAKMYGGLKLDPQ